MTKTLWPSYLAPYARAAQQHGGGFGTLLWASPSTQAARFEAITRAVDLNDLAVLDVGCGRADLLDFLIERGVQPSRYVGIEAVDDLVSAAEAKQHRACTIVRADFVVEPHRLRDAAADVTVFSGSLNTLDDASFRAALANGFDAARTHLVFNFLCSPLLAARDYLHWRRLTDVTRGVIAGFPAKRMQIMDDYLEGDCTIALEKHP